VPGPIVTVTLNPAIDQTLVVDEFAVGAANRVTEARLDPGGKGVNVSQALKELGVDSIAAGLAPGSVGRFIETELTRGGITVDFVPTAGETRTNLTLIDAKHHVATTIHNAGPETDPRLVDELRERLREHYAPGGWLVVGGSLPPPLEPSVYADLIRDAQAAGVQTALDSEGDALRAGLSANPDLVRLSPATLEELTQTEYESDEDYLDALEAIRQDGVGRLFLTPRDGPAWAVSADGAWRVIPPTVPTATVLSEVGWTDATLAGVIQILATGGSFEDALRRGIAAGRATIVTPGSMVGEASTVAAFEEQVRLEQVREAVQP
jgi:1-phosphofructokinase family hexose kinase